MHELTEDFKKQLAEISRHPISWAEFFITLPGQTKKFQPNYTQKMILSMKKRKKLVLTHRRLGKCVEENSFIYLSNGERVLAKDLVNKHFKLLTFSDGKQIEVDAFAQHNAVEKVYRITTSCGREIVRNGAHPFWKKDVTESWTETKDLKVGDSIAAPIILQYSLSDQEITEKEIISLASLSKVPDQVFLLSAAQLHLYLSAIYNLYKTDKNSIALQHSDKDFLSSIQHLWLRFGMNSILSTEEKNYVLIVDQSFDKIPEQSFSQFSNCRWETITEIKTFNKKTTIAISVPDYNTYLTDFYEHNTMSGIIYCLWKCFTAPLTEVLIIAPGEAQLVKFFADLDDILFNNPLLEADVTVRRSKPNYTREFSNSSKIRGFIAKNGSPSLRGQSGDLIYVDEADFIDPIEWKVIDPIIKGDKNRKPPELIATSTPNINPKSRFMQMVETGLNQDKDSEFYDIEFGTIFMPLDKNPEYSPEEVESIRKTYLPDRLLQYEQEYLCRPVNDGEWTVFKQHQIQEACVLQPFTAEHKYGYPKTFKDMIKKSPAEIRIMGVDWDRVQAGPSLLVVSYFPGFDHFKVIYREEVDKNIPHLFNYTCDRIIDLYKVLNLDWIYCEATSDVMQVETLQLLARQRAPDAYNRIIGINFNSNHKSYDLVTKEEITRNIKNVIVGHLQNLFENGRVKFPVADTVLLEQLSIYKILSYNSRGASYSKTNEHFIDALGLACYGFYVKYDNPLARHVSQGGIMNVQRELSPESKALKFSNRERTFGYRTSKLNSYQSRVTF